MRTRPVHASSRLATLALVILLVASAVALSGCLSMRPDAVRSRIGVVGHHSGEMIAAARIETSEGEVIPIPVFWTATPFSIRLDAIVGEGGPLPVAVTDLSKRYPALAPYLTRGSALAGAASAARPADVPSIPYMELFVPLGPGERIIQLENALDEDAGPLGAGVIAASGKAVYIMRSTDAGQPYFVRVGGFSDIRDIEVFHGMCYVADAAKGTGVIDLSADAPTVVRTIDTGARGGARSVSTDHDRLFIAEDGAVRCLDSSASIAMPGVTRIAAIRSTPGVSIVWAVAGSDVKVFACNGTSFEDIGTASLDGAVGTDICLETIDRAYVATDRGAAFLLAEEGFDAISLTGSLPTADRSWGVALLGREAVLSDGRGGNRLIAGSLEGLDELFAMEGVSEGDSIAMGDQVAFVTDRSRGLRVYALQSGIFPVLYDTVRTESTPTVVVTDDDRLLTLGAGRLELFAVAPDGVLSPLATAAVTPAPVAAALSGPLAYTVGPDGLAITDLDTPGTPRVGFLAIAGSPRSVVVDGTTAYVGCAARIWAIDVTNASAPRVLGSVASPAPVTDLRVRSGRLYAAAGTAGLRILNVTNPARMVALGSLAITGRPLRSLDVTGTIVYAATGGSVEAIDVAAPARPRSVAYFRTMSANALRVGPVGLPGVAGGSQGMFVMSNVRWVKPTALVYNVTDGAAYLTTASPAATLSVDVSDFPVVSGPLGNPLSEYMGVTLNDRSWGVGPIASPGDYTVEAVARDVTGAEARSRVQFRVMTVSRHQGEDRYSTAAAVSEYGFESTGTVVIALGEPYYDAVVAAPLAHVLGAPLLLSGQNGVPASSTAEIRRLGATKAVLVGGTSALRPSIVDDLVRAGITHVERLGGRDAADTARLVALRIRAAEGHAPYRVFVTTLDTCADAAGASGVAAYQHAPILFVGRGSVPAATRAAFNALKPRRTVILGSTGSIGTGLALPGTVQRLGGANRWEVNRSVLAYALKAGMTLESLWVSSSRRLSDACASNVVASNSGQASLLAGDVGLNPAAAWTLRANRRRVVHLHIAGGAVSASEGTAILRALGLQDAPPPVAVEAPGPN